MSLSKVKEEENCTDDESQPWREQMMDIKFHDIKKEVKKESNHGKLICKINDVFLAESCLKTNLTETYF